MEILQAAAASAISVLIAALPMLSQAGVSEADDAGTLPDAANAIVLSDEHLEYIDSIDWYSISGEKLTSEQVQELEIKRIERTLNGGDVKTGNLQRDSATPFAYVVPCGTKDYRVQYDQYADPTVRSVCFTEWGVTSWQNAAFQTLIAVCPGEWIGQVEYGFTWNSTHYWSEERGPYATNNTCFRFDANDLYPDRFYSVALTTPPPTN